MSFATAPTGWAACNGQLLPIAQNSDLFSLLGAKYGGDGQTSFALPYLPGVLSNGRHMASDQPLKTADDLPRVPALHYCICIEGDMPSTAAPAGPIDAFAGEIRALPYDFAPGGWAPCDGRLLETARHEALRSQIGSYGGDSFEELALPTLAPLAARVGSLNYYIAIEGVFFFVNANGPNPFLTDGGEVPDIEPMAGETRIFAFDFFSPPGWLQCRGQTVPVSEYDTLFALIGTTFGGDGQASFGVPDVAGPFVGDVQLTVGICMGKIVNYSIDVETATDVANRAIYDIELANKKLDFTASGLPREQAEQMIVAVQRLFGARPGTKAHIEADAALAKALEGLPGEN